MSLRFLVGPISALAVAAAAHAQVPATNFSDVSRADVVDESGDALGTLSDVVVDADGRVKAILIGQGGVLGIGQTLKRMPIDALPAIADGKLRLDGQTTDSIAALPDYAETKPAEQEQASAPPPVSGANQTAPQSASVNVPVTPAQLGAKPDTSLPPTPENDAATGKAAADSSRAPAASPTLGEETAQGSGSSGMAPQQGTGTGATQASPGANENAKGEEGNAAGAEPQLNQQYGREEQPDNKKMPEGTSDRAAADAQSVDQPAIGNDVTPGPEKATSSWRLGKIVGATVIGDRDGIEVKDIRLTADRAETVVLAREGQPDATVPFSGLNLGGTADEPQVALTLQPVVPAPEEAARP